jgi:hypothetical protein
MLNCNQIASDHYNSKPNCKPNCKSPYFLIMQMWYGVYDSLCFEFIRCSLKVLQLICGYVMVFFEIIVLLGWFLTCIFSQCVVVSDAIWWLAMRFMKEEKLSENLNQLLPIEHKISFLEMFSRIWNSKSLQSEGACFLFLKIFHF